MNHEWKRVGKDDPCGICGKQDWCTFSLPNGDWLGGWCCMRIDSERPLKNGGHLHAFDGERPKPKEVPLPPAQPLHFDHLLHGWRQETTSSQISELGMTLGVSGLAIDELGAGWAPEHSAWAFPMWNPDKQVSGIRLRNDVKKWAVKGSKHGVFFAEPAMMRISTDRIYICEGPTDTAAALTIGLFAIGRACCLGGEEIINAILDQLNPYEVCVVFDNDGPGVTGAEKLCGMLALPVVRFVPPCKDLRATVANGANAALIEDMLKNSRRSKK